ncbi:hypothetical protein CULT_670022 [[Clostridium] ultunense Esp]|nr:hypothetical protein CULT_670022 [[Clostridium] ultunense Esp]
MKIFFRSNQLVLNSKEEFILFGLNSQGGLEYTLLDSSSQILNRFLLHKDNVLKYDIDIDTSDKIHLIALMKSGELNYSLYENGNWSNAIIAKFDLQSKVYGDINILAESNNIDIIYGYANLINSKLWTIQHVTGYNQSWEQNIVVKFASNKNTASYIIDRDSLGNIQLIYNSVEGYISQIYHTFYNTYAKKWNPSPQKISTSNINKIFPYIFVDTKNNIHSLWLEDLDRNRILKYSRFGSDGERKYIWNQVKIPYIPNCSNYPIIFEEKGLLKIIYNKSDSIGYIYSADYGNTWYHGEDNQINFSNTKLIKISNYLRDSKDIKINHIYASIEKDLDFIFLDYFMLSDIELSNTEEDMKETIEKDRLENIEAKIDELLNMQQTVNFILSENINSQKKIEKNVEYILEILMNKKSSFFDKLFK